MFAGAFIAWVLPLMGITFGQSLKPYSQPWEEGNYHHPPLAIRDDRDRSCTWRHEKQGPYILHTVHYTIYDRNWSPYDQNGVQGGCGRGLLDNLRGTCVEGWSCAENRWECTAFNNETTGEHGMYAHFWLVPLFNFYTPSTYIQEAYRKGAHGENFKPRKDKRITCCEETDTKCIADAQGARVEPQLP